MQTCRLRIFLTIFVYALFSACSGDAGPPLVANDIHIFESPPGRAMSAGYLTLSNASNEDLRVTHVTSPQFGSVEIHESMLEDGVAKMRAVPELLIPAKSSTSLQPGGMHLMLMRPIGETKLVALHFYDDDTLLLTVQASMERRND